MTEKGHGSLVLRTQVLERERLCPWPAWPAAPAWSTGVRLGRRDRQRDECGKPACAHYL